jgi:hypothetical protein
MIDKSKEKNEIVLYKNPHLLFLHLLWSLVIVYWLEHYNLSCWNISVKHNMFSFSYDIQEYWDFIIDDFHQNEL